MTKKLLNGNQLKILGCIFMLIDHLGFFLFPDIIALRIIGRLAMPIFAFMIAEGAYYSKNKPVYLASILVLGILISMIVFAATKTINLNILISFSLSLILIFLFDKIRDNIILKKNKLLILSIIIFVIYSISLLVFMYFNYIEFQLFSILIPFVLSLINYSNKYDYRYKNIVKLIAYLITYTICMVISIFWFKINTDLYIQVYGYFAGIFILLYNDTKGKVNLKYLFYIFYPLHIGILYLIKEGM